MSRKSTGTVRYFYSPELQRECWRARFTRGDKTRSPWIDLDPTIAPDDEPGARIDALAYVPTAAASTKDGVGLSVADYSTKKWLPSRPGKTAKDNGSHLEHHILPEIGKVPMQRLTSTHGDELVAALDRKIVAGTLSAKSAKNVWGTVKRMLRDAAHAKPSTGLRCLESNPFRDVQPPERCKTKQALNFVYPSEFLSLMGHPRVPTKWKRNVAVAIFLGLRDGEQRALRWEHVDLDHGVVTVCETFDRHSKAVREGTKTGAARIVPIPAPLLPLLREMHDAHDEGLVCRGIASQRAMARGLRTWLRVAGVSREALHKTTSVNRALRWHDLRGTSATWLACAGKSGPEIRDVLGHTQVSMTDKYMRNATVIRGGAFGEPFPVLPPVGNRHSIGMSESAVPKLPEAQGYLRGGRDSNPRPPA